MVRGLGCSLIALSALTAAVFSCDQGRAESWRGLEGVAAAPGSSLVGSFLPGGDPDLAALEGSVTTAPPDRASPTETLSSVSSRGEALDTVLLPAVPALDAPTPPLPARPRLHREPVTTRAPAATDPVTRRVKLRSGPDPFEFSRSAFPLVVGPMPASLVSIRPMAGPVVGVRPAYIRPAQTD